MVNSIPAGEARMKSPAQHLRDGSSWSGWCESFVVRFGGFSRSADSATLARAASGSIVSTDHTKAPAGAIHWWADKGGADGGAGHVAVSLGHDLAAMASARVTVKWGDASGTVPVASYDAATSSFLTYLGWTWDFMGEELPEVTAYRAAEAAKAKAAADAKAAAEAKAAADAAAAKAKAAEEAKAAAAAEVAQAPSPAATVAVVHGVFLAREAGAPEVYLVSGTTKHHLSRGQAGAYHAAGFATVELPAEGLADFTAA